MVSARSHRVSRVPWYSGSCRVSSGFGYGALTLSGRLFQSRSPAVTESLMQSEPRDARITVWALPRSLAATYGIDVSFSSSGYLDVSVPRVSFSQAMYSPVDNCTLLQLSSLIRRSAGQSDICSLPQLFAACHVLLRLPVPRHPPCALSCLTNLSLAFSSLCCVAACSFVSYIHSYAPSSFARAPCLKRKILRDACLH